MIKDDLTGQQRRNTLPENLPIKPPVQLGKALEDIAQNEEGDVEVWTTYRDSDGKMQERVRDPQQVVKVRNLHCDVAEDDMIFFQSVGCNRYVQ
jgi:hypothetical protein